MNELSKKVSEKILSDIHTKLHPKLTLLLAKIFFVHLTTAVITLSICPQFGFRMFKLPINLMHSFMIFGLPLCNFLCGLFFTATSIVMASVVLNHDELRALRFQKMLTAGLLILSSIGFFSIMNPNLFLEFSLLWLLGAITGIVVTLEVSSRLTLRA